MEDLLIRALSFVLIIVMGIVLRKIGFFKESDFGVLAKICLRIALPASVVVSFSQISVDPSMLTLVLLGFGVNVIYIVIALLMNIRSTAKQRSFDVLNFAGYNIGLFTLPFTQSFLGPVGVVATSLFDTGNAVVCLGGAYGFADAIRNGGGFSFKRLFKALSRSVPFLFFVSMTLLNVLGIRLPGAVISFADVIKNANAFLAMLMIGVGFKLSVNKKQIGYILKVLLVRYSIATAAAALFYFTLPFALEIRQALVLVAFSPISSSTPVFTSELNEDFGLSSAINSITIICSILILVTLISVML